MPGKVKIMVVGSCHVDMSLAFLLAQRNDVTMLDTDPESVDTVNRRESAVEDADIKVFFKK